MAQEQICLNSRKIR